MEKCLAMEVNGEVSVINGSEWERSVLSNGSEWRSVLAMEVNGEVSEQWK